MPTSRQAFFRVADYYLAFISRYARRSDLVDQEFLQIQQVCTWLSKQNHPQFLQLLKDLALYLQARSLHSVLLNYCRAGIRIANISNTNPGWLLTLIYEAYFAQGEWEKAATSIRQAIALTETDDPRAHAQAILALGRLQINRGDYRPALQTLRTAEELLRAAGDLEGVASAKAEVAAYHLVRGEYQQALNLYLEVDAIRRKLNPNEPASHSLLMLGVVYRRLKNYPAALSNLNELLSYARSQKNRSAMATAMHHLAWIYYDQRNLEEAKRLGMQAKAYYWDIKDPRGASDSDEQLGLIAFQERDFDTADFYLKETLSTRLKLGNLPGAASTLRRLSTLHLRKGDILMSMRYLVRSLLLYYRIGALGRQRIIKLFRGIFSDELVF